MWDIYTLELISKGFLISWLIVNFEPFQTYIVGTLEGINLGLFKYNKYIYIPIAKILKVLTCHKCCALWSTLIISNWNIYISITTAILAWHYDKWSGQQKISL